MEDSGIFFNIKNCNIIIRLMLKTIHSALRCCECYLHPVEPFCGRALVESDPDLRADVVGGEEVVDSGLVPIPV